MNICRCKKRFNVFKIIIPRTHKYTVCYTHTHTLGDARSARNISMNNSIFLFINKFITLTHTRTSRTHIAYGWHTKLLSFWQWLTQQVVAVFVNECGHEREKTNIIFHRYQQWKQKEQQQQSPVILSFPSPFQNRIERIMCTLYTYIVGV